MKFYGNGKSTEGNIRTSAGILNLPVIFESVAIQYGRKWSQMGKNCIKWSYLPVKNRNCLSK